MQRHQDKLQRGYRQIAPRTAVKAGENSMRRQEKALPPHHEVEPQVVHKSCRTRIEEVYSRCRAALDPDAWERMLAAYAEDPGPEEFPDVLSLKTGDFAIPGFLPDLARLEWALYSVENSQIDVPLEVRELAVNPNLRLLQLSWKNLTSLFCAKENTPARPEPGREYVLVWRIPETTETRVEPASDEDLLVLKMAVEGIDPDEVARTGALRVGAVEPAIDRAAAKGLLIKPESRIRRDRTLFPSVQDTDGRFLTSPSFALQWHITQACDLHCKHCYDRSQRSPLKLEQGLGILDDLRAFCRSRNVRGHVTFTGGNPLLYPHFLELYRAAAERGFGLALLGNPAPRKRIEELIEIQRPDFFQVSLEGLQEHNDTIRGAGHFERIIDFLDLLRDLDVSSMVMLTLTRDNMDQVLPLAEVLRGLTDHFTFNRLSMVGEGANLKLPRRDNYVSFLKAYVDAAEKNPAMGLKDNLINILYHNRDVDLFGGCTGYGCGAAFNFMAVLPDGDVHACRKFPSLVGNVFEQTIAEIYDGDAARRYRAGCSACRSCDIRPVCGGCLAAAYSHGLDIFQERDPFCFIDMPSGRKIGR